MNKNIEKKIEKDMEKEGKIMQVLYVLLAIAFIFTLGFTL